MTARQKSLSARIPKLCAFYFPIDKSTGIAPVTNVLEGAMTEGETVKCSWNDSEIDAIIVKLSDYRSVLTEALEDYEPPSEEPDNESTPRPEDRQQDHARQGTTKTVKQPPQKQNKRSAQSIGSGESQRCLELPSNIPDYPKDDTIQAALQESSVNKRSTESQTDQAKTINNSTKTEVDQCELLKQILEKVTSLEKQVLDMKQQLSKQHTSAIDTPALVSSALQSLNDPYDFEASEVPFTPTTPTTRTSIEGTPSISRHLTASTPTTRLFPSPRCQPKTVMNELGFLETDTE